MDLFDELFNDMWSSFGGFTQYRTPDERRCPCCSQTISRIQKNGKFGCGECYKTFRKEAESILKQIHTNSTHTGKIPSKSGAQLKAARKKEELRKKLQEAVNAENYEEAAKLHREIKQLEGNEGRA